MKATILYGNKSYTDNDLNSHYYQFKLAWDKYTQETYPKFKEQYAKEVIATYNEYYYQRKEYETLVYKKNNRSFMTKLVDKTFGILYDDSAVKYSCHFKEELPHRAEVLSLIEEYGEFTYDNHKFVIQH